MDKDVRSQVLTVVLVRRLYHQRKKLYRKWYQRVNFHLCFFFQAEDGIRDLTVTGVQTCALPIWLHWWGRRPLRSSAPRHRLDSPGCARTTAALRRLRASRNQRRPPALAARRPLARDRRTEVLRLPRLHF